MRSSSGCVAAASGTSCPRKSSPTTPRCTALCRGGSSLACSISSGRSSSRRARNSAEWTSSGRPPMGPWARHALGGSRRPQSHRQSQKRAQTLPAGRGRWRSSFGGDSRSERARLQAVGGHARCPIVVGWPAPNEQAPCYEHLCLDKGYDKAPAREIVEQRGYVPHIRKIGEEKRDDAGVKRYPARRWVVERTLGWLSKCRAILVRYDKKAANYLGLIKVACILLWYRRQHRLSLLR